MKSKSTLTPLTQFWNTLVAHLKARGIFQRQLATELRLTEPTLSRRIRGDGHLPHWGEIEHVVARFELTAERAQLRALWLAAVRFIHGMEPEAAPSLERAESGIVLQQLEHDQEAIPLLNEAYRWLLRDAASGKRSPLLPDVCLRLSAGYGNLGRHQEALKLAQQAVRITAESENAFLIYQSRHQEALMLRLVGTDLDAAYARFTRLIQDYQEGVRARTAGPDAVARAYRDGARALATTLSRRAEVRTMHAEALRWARQARQNALQQEFHTRLDQAALAIIDEEPAEAELFMKQSDQLLLTALREGEVWLSHRAQAKFGLTFAAFGVLTGDRDDAIRRAQSWLEREEPLGNQEACRTARAIISWAEGDRRTHLPAAVLLR